MTFYIGPEVNHTPAYSKKTLFVEEYQQTKFIEETARQHKASHISLGASNSFDIHNDWNSQITALLDKGFAVTLQYPVELHYRVFMELSQSVLQSKSFIPLPIVRIVGMSEVNPNLTLKIDDQSGEGTWALHFHQLMDSNRFTPANEIQMLEIEPTSGEIPKSVFHVQIPPSPKPSPVVKVKETAALNPQDIGLAPEEKSALKPEVEEEQKPVIRTIDDAAAAYAEGATKDPLSAEASKKPNKKK